MTYPIPMNDGIMLNRAMAPDGAEDTATDGYPGFDRYGRVAHHLWTQTTYDENGTYANTANQPAIFHHAYTYDKDSLRTSDTDARPLGTTFKRPRDWWYGYDPLDRLIEAGRGIDDAVPANRVPAVGARKWDLDILGNWGQNWVDESGDGVFGDNDTPQSEREVRTHNKANEIATSTFFLANPGAAGPVYEHDANGNMTRSDPYRGVYDAWNRLVKLTDGTNTIAEYAYNGLKWRTSARIDTAPGSFDGVLDREIVYYYSEGWQLLEERIDFDDDGTAAPDGTINLRGQLVWGARYIDDAVARRVDRDGDGEFGSDDGGGDARGLFFYCTDPLFNPRVVLAEGRNAASGWVADERVVFSPYGQVEHAYAGDFDWNGTSGDVNDNVDLSNAFNAATEIGQAGYDARFDLNFDGLYNVNDIVIYSNEVNAINATGGPVTPAGQLTDINDTAIGSLNPVGFTGHVAMQPLAMWLARHRVLEPVVGRWLQRDPAGLIEGTSLFQFASSSPPHSLDPLGLQGVRGNNTSFALHYFAGVGADVDLGFWQFGSAYKNHPAVRAEMDRIKGALDTRMSGIGARLMGQLDCTGCYPDVDFELASGTIRGRILRDDFVAKPPSACLGNTGLLFTWFWFHDWTFAIGGHRLNYDYNCLVSAGCDPTDTGGSPKWGYICWGSYKMEDKFTDPFDLIQGARALNITIPLFAVQGSFVEPGTAYDIKYSFVKIYSGGSY